MIYSSATTLRVALLVLFIALAVANTVAIGNRSYRREEGENRNNNNNEDFRGFRARPRLEPAVIRINGRTEVIDLQSPGVTGGRAEARAGSGSMIGPAEDIISLEIISGPPNFGLFLTSRKDKRFVSPTLNWDRLSIGDPPAFEDSSQYKLPSSFPLKEEGKKEREEEENDDDGNILLRAADRLFYYTLDNPNSQVVTVFENTNRLVRFKIMDYKISPVPRLSIPALTRQDRLVARWQFPRRQDVSRLAVVQAPRGRFSKCQVTIIGAWIDDIRIGRPLSRPKAGVGGIVCFR